MSEPNGTDAGAQHANGRLAQHPDVESGLPGEAAEAHDSWFEPAHTADGRDSNGSGATRDWDPDQTDWFLRTGRAGLLPDSMTESWEDSGHANERPETAGAPPWAGDFTPTPDEPPPWESGPWPGADEERPARSSSRRPAAQASAQRPAQAGNWQASAAAAAGVLPLVVPGAALGVLGLRKARTTGTGQLASWAGIALSVVWAIVLIIWLAGGGASQDKACNTYQTRVSYPVAQVLRDLSNGAPNGVLTADLQKAITQANSAAVGASQIPVRDAMVSLTGGLQATLAQASSSRSAATYPALRGPLAANVSAVTSACKS